MNTMLETTTRHATAEQWASTRAELDRANEKERLARVDAERLRARLETLSKQLVECVGDNISERAFHVSTGEIVLVEHKRGVRLITPERA